MTDKKPDFCFLFYVGDWVGGTLLMTWEHKGAYMDLLMAQFNNGHLSLADIKQVLGHDGYVRLWSRLEKKFILDSEGLLFNKKLDTEKFKRQAWVQGRAGNLRGKGKKTPHMGDHMGDHTEKEKEKEREVKDKIPYKDIIDDLNKKVGKSYKHTTPAYKQNIKARFKEGFTFDNFITVHENMCKAWLNTEQASFLRPITLYGNRFDGYLNFIQPTKNKSNSEYI